MWRPQGRLLDQPEFNIAIFGFLLNFVWEMWQVPFYEGMAEKPHWEGVWFCTRATLGDVVIMLAAFWCVAAVVKSRAWVLAPNRSQTTGFVLIGMLITIVIEEVSLRFGRWSYDALMPTLPLLGTGVVPLAQWVLVPLAVLWVVRRQLTQPSK